MLNPNKAADTITLVHFNDVYNVEQRDVEPVGGAGRFLTAVKQLSNLNPLILFSGDIFAPSISKAGFSDDIIVIFVFACSEHLHQGGADGARDQHAGHALCGLWQP